jgi:hypothetical protein
LRLSVVADVRARISCRFRGDRLATDVQCVPGERGDFTGLMGRVPVADRQTTI